MVNKSYNRFAPLATANLAESGATEKETKLIKPNRQIMSNTDESLQINWFVSILKVESKQLVFPLYYLFLSNTDGVTKNYPKW